MSDATKTTSATGEDLGEFGHFHAHSEYSSLDGGCKVDDIVARLNELDFKFMGLTDHGVMQGLPEFQDALKKAGIKPILGIEAYLTDDRHDKSRGTPTWHLTLIAETTEGYKNLCKLSSWAFLDGTVQTFGRARARADWELLERYSEGVICLTGCMAGPVMGSLMSDGSITKAKAYTERLVEIYGAGNVYGEIQNVGIVTGIPGDSEAAKLLDKTPLSAEEAGQLEGPHGDLSDEIEVGEVPLSQSEANRLLVEEICRPLGLEPVATGDVHYLRADDADPHDAMLCIGTGQIKRGKRKFSLLPKRYHMRSLEEMKEALPDYPEAITNTVAIAKRCSAEIEWGKELLPRFAIPEPFSSAKDYLEHLCREGVEERYPEGHKFREAAFERLEMELGVIGSMGFNDYFLITWDIFQEARRRNIPWGPGRGSAAGAIVAYSLGITELCPLEYELLFERFLNPDRISMPDIDMDFATEYNGGRDALVEYAVEKYNAEAGGLQTAVARIVTFSKYKGRGALKDSAKVLAEPTDEGRAAGMAIGKKLAGMVPEDPTLTLAKLLDPESKEARRYPDESKRLRKVIENGGLEGEVAKQALWLDGMVRAYSTHAAAVIIADHDLTDELPLQKLGKDKPIEVQYSMNPSERLGLLKMDFLVIRNLDVIWDACDKIKHTQGVEIHPYKDIPLDDKDTYGLLARAESIGLFQVESAGMQSALSVIGPTEFDDIIALVALYRPGAMAHIENYAARKHGRQKVEFLDERLRSITEATYAVCVSGDARIIDAETGLRHRLDELEGREGMLVHGVDDDWNIVPGRLERWIDNGTKVVHRMRLRSGAELKVTADHRILTEDGWVSLEKLRVGDYVATPRTLPSISASTAPSYDADRLRVLGHLIADGDISGPTAGFVSASRDELIPAYRAAVTTAFPGVALREIDQARGVLRLAAAKTEEYTAEHSYHTPNQLNAWLCELGLRNSRPAARPRGCRSAEKFVPEFVFGLNNADISLFLAALWDCDGHVGQQVAFYKTISHQLAHDVRDLLLRLGINSRIYESSYTNPGGIERTAYQVSTFDCGRFAALVQPKLVLKEKRDFACCGKTNGTSISSESYLGELDSVKGGMSYAAVSRLTGKLIGNHRRAQSSGRDRLTAKTVTAVAEAMEMPRTLRALNLHWDRIISIEEAGEERVYDLTIEGVHSFVADGVVVHNCLYQEQNMLIARELAGFTPGEADDLRKAIGKKLHDKMDLLEPKFLEGCKANGVAKEVAEAIWADNKAAADYSFNKSHAACYGLISYITAYLKCHYPNEYMAALISSVMGKKDKPGLYLREAKRMGLRVLPPDINRSLNDFAVMESEEAPGESDILFGLNALRGVGSGVVGEIKSEREARGPFRSMFDLIRRMPQLNKTVVQALVKGGALDSTGASRRAMFDLSEESIERIRKELKQAEKEFVASIRSAAESGGKRPTIEKRGVEGGAKVAFASEFTAGADALRAGVIDALEREQRRLARKEVRDAIKAAGGDQAQIAGIAGEEGAGGESEREIIERRAEAKLEELRGEREQLAGTLMPVLESSIHTVREARAEEEGFEAALADEADPPLNAEEWPSKEKLNLERAVLGIYVSGHPIEEIREQWAWTVDRALGKISDADITPEKAKSAQLPHVGGVVVAHEAKKIRSGTMHKVILEDLTGSREITIWPDTAEGKESLLVVGEILSFKVTIREDSFAAQKKSEEVTEDDTETATPEADEEGKPVQLVAATFSRWDPAKNVRQRPRAELADYLGLDPTSQPPEEIAAAIAAAQQRQSAQGSRAERAVAAAAKTAAAAPAEPITIRITLGQRLDLPWKQRLVAILEEHRDPSGPRVQLEVKEDGSVVPLPEKFRVKISAALKSDLRHLLDDKPEVPDAAPVA